MTADTLVAALGGSKVLKGRVVSYLDLVSATREGLPAGVAERVVEYGFLEPEELYTFVIPRRTFARRQDENEPLTPAESDRLVRIIRVIVRAIEVLGTPEKAKSWLRSSNKALHGHQPLSLLATDLGARMVEQVLGRIEYGVYS